MKIGRHYPTSRHTAAVLFEVMLAIAIFTGAAMFTLRAVSHGLRELDRTTKQAQAVDMARTTFAQLEAGLVDLADLRQGDPPAEDRARSFDEAGDQPRWTIETETVPTEYEGLQLVELTVREELGDGFGAEPDSEGVSFTLRQLIRLSPMESEPFEEDEMVRDLVEPREGME